MVRTCINWKRYHYKHWPLIDFSESLGETKLSDLDLLLHLLCLLLTALELTAEATLSLCDVKLSICDVTLSLCDVILPLGVLWTELAGNCSSITTVRNMRDYTYSLICIVYYPTKLLFSLLFNYRWTKSYTLICIVTLNILTNSAKLISNPKTKLTLNKRWVLITNRKHYQPLITCTRKKKLHND